MSKKIKKAKLTPKAKKTVPVKAAKVVAKPAAKTAVKVVAKPSSAKSPKQKVKDEIRKAGFTIDESPAGEKSVKGKSSKVKSSDAGSDDKSIALEAVEGEEVILTDADGKRYCKVIDCDEIAVIEGHCRLHYIMFWKRGKTKTKILDGGKLDKYIEALTLRYPDKYLEILRKDLLSEKEFNTIITEMDADDAEDAESEEEDNRFTEEIRGTHTTNTDDDDGGF